MHFFIVTPGVNWVATGNRFSAEVFGSFIADLGHRVTTAGQWDSETDADALVALHAEKSHDSIRRFREKHSDRPIILVLTGTDIYPDLSSIAIESVEAANRLVCLQDKALKKIPAEYLDKAQVIRHSATGLDGEYPKRSLDPFEICVVGHLRDVKDPMRAAYAAQRLPAQSKIRILHAGAILDEKYQSIVESEMRDNPRYCWMGPLDPNSLKRLMAKCQAIVVSSISEGGARVAGEAVVLGTPVLGSKIDGLLGHFGDDYPAFFPVGDTGSLAALMINLESDEEFRKRLRDVTISLQPIFDPAREREAWEELITGL